MTGRDPVREQYERWPYPVPAEDLDAFPLHGPGSRYADLRDHHFGYWPTAPAYRAELDILVAGCGTFAGAAYAYFYPRARVTAFDVSTASLAHEERLKRRHGLANLTLRELRLEDAAALGAEYDFISVVGVLHHLEDPVAGLRALGGCLRPDGVLAGMVYGRYGRLGVSMMQEVFRALGLGQDPAGVQAVKEGLSAVPPWHPVRDYLERAREDLLADTALVDAFLHRRERAYTVAECLQLVGSAGLAFQGWDDNFLYHPELTLAEDHPFRARLAALPEPEAWRVGELMFGAIPAHFFHACRRDRDPATYRADFAGSRFLAWTPVPRAAIVEHEGAPSLVRGAFPPVGLDASQARIVHAIDGQRTIGACLRAAGLDPSEPAIVDYARNMFRSLWRFGYMLFRW